jgi:XTP/dITP diphosphohydrolase
MARLLIATTNQAKLAEYRLLMRELPLMLLSISDIGISDAPAETGATFAENAMLKARYYFDRSAIATLADDGGLEIDALGGTPGVRSHRWTGEGRDDDQSRVDKVIRRMRDVEDGRRTARLRASMALVYRVGGELRERIVEAALEGVIPREAYPHYRPGFPYRAVLFIPHLGRYVAELGEEEEAAISQRRIALKNARPYLDEIASQAD